MFQASRRPCVLLFGLAVLGCERVSTAIVPLPPGVGPSWITGVGPRGAPTQRLTLGALDRGVELIIPDQGGEELELLSYPTPIEGVAPGPLEDPRCGRPCALLFPDRAFRLEADSLELARQEGTLSPDAWRLLSAPSPTLLTALVPDSQRCPVCRNFETSLLPLGTTSIPSFVSAEADGRALIGFHDGSMIRLSVTGEVDPVCAPGGIHLRAGLRGEGADRMWVADGALQELGVLRLSAQVPDRPCHVETSTSAPTLRPIRKLAGRPDPDDPELYAITDHGELFRLAEHRWRQVADIALILGLPDPERIRRVSVAYFDSEHVLAASGGEELWERIDGLERKMIIQVPGRRANIVSIGRGPDGVVLGLDRFGLAHYRGTDSPALLSHGIQYDNPTTILRGQDRWLIFLETPAVAELIDDQPPCPKQAAPNDQEPVDATWLRDGSAIAIDASGGAPTREQAALLVRPVPDAACEP